MSMIQSMWRAYFNIKVYFKTKATSDVVTAKL